MILKAHDGDGWFEDGEDRGRLLARGAQTSGRYGLMEWVVAPGGMGRPRDFGAHRHEACEETFLVRSGSLEFMLDKTVATLTAGDFVRVPPGTRHGYANVSAAPVELLVAFHPAGLEELFLKYRTDRADAPDPEGFAAEATRLHSTVFETG